MHNLAVSISHLITKIATVLRSFQVKVVSRDDGVRRHPNIA